jgi:hypothetical protein
LAIVFCGSSAGSDFRLGIEIFFFTQQFAAIISNYQQNQGLTLRGVAGAGGELRGRAGGTAALRPLRRPQRWVCFFSRNDLNSAQRVDGQWQIEMQDGFVW